MMATIVIFARNFEECAYRAGSVIKRSTPEMTSTQSPIHTVLEPSFKKRISVFENLMSLIALKNMISLKNAAPAPSAIPKRWRMR